MAFEDSGCVPSAGTMSTDTSGALGRTTPARLSSHTRIHTGHSCAILGDNTSAPNSPSSSSPSPSSPFLQPVRPSSSSSTSSRHYSPVSTPYPIVHSSPSLIDSARISAFLNTPLPPTTPPLHSSIPHPPHYPPLPIDLSSHPLNLPSTSSPVPSLSAVTFTAATPTTPTTPALPETEEAAAGAAFTPLASLRPRSYPQTTLDSALHLPPDWSSFHSTNMSTYQPTYPSALPEVEADSDINRITTAPIVANMNVNTSEELQQRPQQQQHDDDYADMATAAPDRPRSVLDMAIDTASNNPAGREVRRNALRRMTERWDSIPRNARIFLIFTCVTTLLKLAATVAVLIIDRNSSCSYLKILLILFAVRVAIALPIAIYSHMHPRVQGAPLTTRYILLERVRTLLEITGTCLFFLANYFLFTQSQCRVAAPAVYYMTVVYVILGYIVILIPIILCLAVILCLPLVLRIMRTLGLGPVGVVKGATEEMIASIHVVKYRRPVIVEAEAGSGVASTVVDMDENSSSSTELCATPAAGAISAVVTSAPGTIATDTGAPLLTTPGRPKRGFLGLFKNSKKSAISTRPISESTPTYPEPAEFEYLTLMDPQDAVCAICLCDYEDEEELRKLNCSHHFHKACVDEWLRLNRNCPLCKRDIEELAGGRPAEVAGAAAVSGALASASISPTAVPSSSLLLSSPSSLPAAAGPTSASSPPTRAS